jgi:hypothetical protein
LLVGAVIFAAMIIIAVGTTAPTSGGSQIRDPKYVGKQGRITRESGEAAMLKQIVGGSGDIRRDVHNRGRYDRSHQRGGDRFNRAIIVDLPGLASTVAE